MTHGSSQELDVGLHIGHTFQDVSILYPLYAPYRFLQELEHIMFCAVLAIRSGSTYWPYIPECFYPLITICAIQIPVGVRTYHVLCCTGDQVRFDILAIHSRMFLSFIHYMRHTDSCRSQNTSCSELYWRSGQVRQEGVFPPQHILASNVASCVGALPGSPPSGVVSAVSGDDP